MSHDFLRLYGAMRRVLGICPHCGEMFRLSDVPISCRRAFRPDWLDEIDRQLERLDRRLESIQEREAELKEKEAEKGRRQLPRLIRRAAPVVARLGFHPQEVKAIFHPVDLVAFDGMKSRPEVRRIVLLDAEVADDGRKRLQEQVRAAVEHREYHWETVNVGDDGSIDVEGA